MGSNDRTTYQRERATDTAGRQVGADCEDGVMSDVTLYHGDCLEILPTLEAGSVDLCIFSPPYNVGVKYGDKDGKSDRLDPKDYKLFSDRVMKILHDVIVSGGRVCVEIGGSSRNLPLSWMWQDAAYKAGFGLYSEIGIPHRKTNPTAWGSYLKADMVFTIPNFHMMYVFYKTSERKNGGESTIIKDEFVEYTRGWWKINYSVGKVKEHPATFPIELPSRCIKLFGHKADTILDPFAGSGTTGVACIQTGRRFIGIEIDEGYYQIAKDRIAEAQLQMRLPI